MAVRLSDAWLDELRSRVPLEEVVSEYVPLKQKGKRFWGCCPLHHEKTPSFSVDTESQLYYCFGCHKGGTVIHFVMELERLDFMDAVKLLAERAHMELPQDGKSSGPSISTDERERIYEANTLAARFFHSLLWQNEGAEMLNYLYKRGLNDSDIRRFGLGASPRGRSTLLDHLTAQGFTPQILEKAGLVNKRDDRYIDMFRGRAMFPIIDRNGKVIGFGGRAMGDAQPKYLNTAETPVFNKRRGLYCLNMAKKEREVGHLVLVEGYMDTVSLRKHGVKGVVATLGTALTDEQVRLIKRFAPEVWISYDGDSAGQKAALRALDMCDEQNLAAKVVDYPAGMDPDDFVKANGKDGFDRLPKLSATEYRMLRARDGLDTSTLDGMTQYAMRCCEVLRKVKNPIEAENHLRVLAHETGYDREILMRQIGTMNLQNAQTPTHKPASSAQIRGRKNNAAQFSPDEVQLLTLLQKGLVPKGMVTEEDFSEGLARRLAAALLRGTSAAAILNGFDDEETRSAAAYAMDTGRVPEREEDVPDMVATTLTAMRRQRLNARVTELETKLAQASASDKQKLLEQLTALYEQIDAL